MYMGILASHDMRPSSEVCIEITSIGRKRDVLEELLSLIDGYISPDKPDKVDSVKKLIEYIEASRKSCEYKEFLSSYDIKLVKMKKND